MKKAAVYSLLSLLAGAPAQAAVLSVCLEGAPEIFNPQLTSSGTTATVLGQIYDGLVSVKKGGSEIEPALAESWSVSSDQRTYTFKLRKDVNWQSNKNFKPSRDFDADDVLFTFDRMMKPDHPYAKVNGGNYITFNTKLADALESVTKVDAQTVAFKLKQPLAPFVGIMAHQSLAITSAEYAETLAKAGTKDQLDRDPVGTGPFALQAYQTNAAVRLKPFAESWGAVAGIAERTAKVDAAVLVISTDASVRLQRALAGECLISLYPNLADREVIAKNPNLQVVQTPVASTGFITFNFKDEQFKDQRVRAALAHAIDMKPLVDVIYNGMGVVTGALVRRHSGGTMRRSAPIPTIRRRRRPCSRRQASRTGSTQLWAVPVSRPYMPNGRRAAEMIQANWAAIGVKAEIVTYEWGEYIKRSRAGEAKVGMFGGIYDFPTRARSRTITSPAIPAESRARRISAPGAMPSSSG